MRSRGGGFSTEVTAWEPLPPGLMDGGHDIPVPRDLDEQTYLHLSELNVRNTLIFSHIADIPFKST